MKTFYILLMLVFLASCGSEVAVTPETPADTVVEQTSEEIDKAMQELPEEIVSISEEPIEAKVVKLSAPYTNPAGPVDMQIEYSLDSDGKIETIEILATTYDLTKFNEGAQVVIGMTLKEASRSPIAGSSLTTPAFQAAFKKLSN